MKPHMSSFLVMTRLEMVGMLDALTRNFISENKKVLINFLLSIKLINIEELLSALY